MIVENFIVIDMGSYKLNSQSKEVDDSANYLYFKFCACTLSIIMTKSFKFKSFLSGCSTNSLGLVRFIQAASNK